MVGLRIDGGGIDRTVPEQSPDHLERFSRAHKAGRRGVSEQIGASGSNIVHAGPLERMSDDTGHRTARDEGPTRRPRAQEDLVVGNPWAGVLDVGQDGIADVLRQRQAGFVPRLAAHPDQRMAPVDVFEPQGDYITRPQGESREKQQDCPVPQAHGRGDFAARDHPLDRLR